MDVAHKRKYKAIVAGTEKDILKCAEEFTPNAILMNMVLEDIDAITILKAFKSSDTLKGIPVYVMPDRDNEGRWDNPLNPYTPAQCGANKRLLQWYNC